MINRMTSIPRQDRASAL